MAKITITQQGILEAIKKHELTAAEGCRLITEFQPAGQTEGPDAVRTVYYHNEWVEVEVPTTRPGRELPETVLLFDRNPQLHSSLETYLREQSGRAIRVVVVQPGREYRGFDNRGYVVNPGSPDDYQQLVADLKHRGWLPEGVVYLWARERFDTQGDGVTAQLDQGFYALLALSRALMEQKIQRLPLVYLYPVFQGASQPLYEALDGFARTIRQENPAFRYKIVGIENLTGLRENDPASLVEMILTELQTAASPEVAVSYTEKTRRAKLLREAEIRAAQDRAVPLRDQGVYLITGGLGGLGLIFAEYLAGQVRAKLVLAGRSALDPAGEARLRRLETWGAAVLYVQADIAVPAEADKLIAMTKQKFGALHGIIHSAGIIRDAFVIQKTREEAAAVLAPKVAGALNLDRATRDESLDFMVLFSSVAAVLGNVGQCDYAFGNAFLDHFARYRVSENRPGATIAINWPLWREGGMRVAEAEFAALAETAGLRMLPTAAGLRIWETVLHHWQAGGPTQYTPLYGETVKIRRALQPGSTPAAAPDSQAPAAVDSVRLLEKTQQYLREIFSELLNMELDGINPDTNFREYGIDSIVVKLFNVNLERQLGPLPKTLLFEYQTLRELSRYLVQNHGAKFNKLLGGAAPSAETGGLTDGWDELQPLRTKFDPEKRRRTQSDPPHTAAGEMEIAIIGLSGVYPQADDLDQFWENLKDGRDCIGEIPPDRWDYRNYFDPDLNKAKDGKIYCKWGGFLQGIDRFDPLFFGISPREAEIMDPQERLLLQVAWAALEDAGYTRGELAEMARKEQTARVGVFIGATNYSYNLVCTDEWAKGNKVLTNSAPWSLANRISFLLNFHGPSLPVDTACSSSLTAIHLACESLKKGECRLAMAGGVNLYLHPSKYVGMSQLRMLSPTGKCYSFGAQSDGIVPGEGVGVILLKPLSRAIADQDHIYGVIKGSAINHGGNTNAFTVPNPNAHAALIRDVLEQSGIDPRTISYVEAHGTGTSLGDPIEISGLSKAYRGFTADLQYCAIGSVKSNIGHLEAAAGIAGITKLLLQLKHKQLAPSIHARELNPNIDFANSPFYVQRELTDWESWPNPGGPRRMAISSFGAGGSNAHVILEEYQAPVTAETDQGPALIVLSARNPERLRVYAAKLAGFLEKRQTGGECEPELNLMNLAYTLQVGREALGHRLAAPAADLPELQKKLVQYSQGDTGPAGWFYAGPKAGKGAGLPETAALSEAVDRALRHKDLSRLAELWVNGAEIPWKLLYPGVAPRRITLPTYPFTEGRYWIERVPAPSGAVGAMKLDTLIDENISTLEEQCFRKRFAGDEFFLTDHGMILPGVVYLEMIRAAGNLANPRFRVVKLRNVVWANPLIIDQGVRDVYVSLNADEAGIGFAVRTRDANGIKQLHSQGKMVYETQAVPDGGPRSLDIAAILRRCRGGEDRAAVYYDQLAALGVILGHRFKGMCELYSNETEAVGVVEIPPELEAGREVFQMHPTLLDGGLQTVFAHVLSRRLPEAEALCLPFVLGELEIINPQLRICYAYVHTVTEPSGANHQPIQYNIWFLDRSGQIAVKMTDYSIRPVEAKANPDQRRDRLAKALSGRDSAFLYCGNVWGRTAPVSGPAAWGPEDCMLIFDYNEALSDALQQRRSPAAPPVILVQPGSGFRKLGETRYEIDPAKPEDYPKLIEALNQLKWTPNRIVHWWSQELFAGTEAQLRRQMGHGIHSCFHLCRALIQRKPLPPTGLIYIYAAPDGAGQPQYAALGSFAKCVRLEHPNLVMKTVALEGNGDPAPQHLTEYLLAEFQPDADREAEIRYRDGERSVRKLVELDRSSLTGTPVLLRQQGVYLITGGAGALGLIIAEYLVKRVQAKIILTGRSDSRPELEERLQRLRELGSEVRYLRADLGQKEEVDRLLAQIKTGFAAIHGVIHCAGLIRDSLLTKKTGDDLEQVLSPKVWGTFYLDQALQGEALDFFALFSSTTAMLGNVGQTDYAYANSFLDHFARWRTARGRSGVTFAINWPLWKDGGMRVDQATLQLFAALGIEPLETAEGLDLFEQGLSLGVSHFMVMKGNPVKLRERLRLEAPREELAVERSLTRGPDEQTEIVKRFQADLLKLIAGILKLPAAGVDPEGELSQFGFDSITFTELANEINAKYRLEVTPTVFFSYATPGAVAAYLCEEYEAQIRDHYRDPAQSPLKFRPLTGEFRDGERIGQSNLSGVPGESDAAAATAERLDGGLKPAPTSSPAIEPVAIIGAGGVLPQSEDPERFWRNLAAEKDLITEIPKDRWDWELYYGDPHAEPDKTSSKWGGFIADVDKFDPLFFNIAPRDAEQMDPQERILIETVWKTIEDAGYRAADLSGTKTGLFLGVSNADYKELLVENRVLTAMTQSLLANRISFLLNLRGPSEPVDTACSSSLVAIHRAVEAIRSGNCEMALAGGVNVIVSPNLYISQSRAGMLAPDGRCKTFDKGADGYVRGEGAGVILLKPLSQARADGDRIYAVIRGTAVNHGGRGTSLTAPNANAQAELLIEAYEKARINPATVSFIEAHGTGTNLGDPIEIDGLKQAFKTLYQKWNLAAPPQPHCGIGAVKTNIGHLEAASGIAGVLKVLWALRHRTLPANLHFKELNPYIRLENTPFYIVAQTRPWERLTDEQNLEIPRRAGVSSFGIGGVNAHVILEEYEDPEGNTGVPADNGDYLFVLSARDQERLREYARLIRDDIDARLSATSGPAKPVLADLIYTLQVGREPREERLAIVVSSLAELHRKLQQYLQQSEAIPGLYQGNTGPDAAAAPVPDEIAAVIRQRDLTQLARFWIANAAIDWRLLYPDRLPRRIALPTYPFARERYWLPAPERAAITQPSKPDRLHPLIDANVSTLREQRFELRLTGAEFFLRDHRVAGQMVLPGAAYLELARAAAALAEEAPVRTLQNLVWIQPLTMPEQPLTVRAGVYPLQDAVEVEVSSGGRSGPKTVYFQCKAGCGAAMVPARGESVDIEAIQKRCTTEKTGTEWYAAFREAGLVLGPGFQSLRRIRANPSEALAELGLPSGAAAEFRRYELHPTLIDGALQTIGILAGPALTRSLYLPFALEELRIFRPLDQECYAYAVPASPEPDRSGNKKFQITLLDRAGRICVEIDNYTIRELKPAAISAAVPAAPPPDAADSSGELFRLLKRLENGELNAAEVEDLWEVI
jgi:acyl transferase domain-containing protein/acyl carrier protein